MEEQEIIRKWLNHEPLTPEEQQVFTSLEGYHSYVQLDRYASQFKAPTYAEDEAFQELQTALSGVKKAKTPSISWIIKIAASVVILLGTYFALFYSPTTQVTTVAHQKTSIILPDASEISLNANSSISYHEKDWAKHRTLRLQGEAYFKVAKGETFTVNTVLGEVTVLGTQFNVIQRPEYFEVVCYEGLVQVNGEQVPAGHSFRILNGTISRGTTNITAPSWIQNKSTFQSMPLRFVIAELERQYGVTVIVEHIDDTKLFTGNFSHDTLEKAVQSISIPMQLRYTITDTTIRLYPE